MFWQAYLRTLPEKERPKDPYIVAGISGNEEIADELLGLYLCGKKYAGSSLLKDYESAGDPLPKVGNYWIILDAKGIPRCLVQTTKVVLQKFKDIGKDIAEAEGEGDLSVHYWRQAHQKFFLPFLEQWGVRDLEEAIVVVEFFRILYKEDLST